MRLNLRPWEAAGLAAGRITALCRVVKPQPEERYNDSSLWYPDRYNKTEEWCFWGKQGTHKQNMCGNPFFRSPFGAPGTVIAGCEAYYEWKERIYAQNTDEIVNRRCIYKADGRLLVNGAKWRSAQTMPTWAVRTWLTVVTVRCCRVQEVTEEEAVHMDALLAELGDLDWTAKMRFAVQFDRDNGPGSWQRNQWVFVAEVKL